MSLVDRILAFGQALQGNSKNMHDAHGGLHFHTTPLTPAAQAPQLSLHPNGLVNHDPNNQDAVDVLLVLYVTQMVNKIAEDSEVVDPHAHFQTHHLRYHGHPNDATIDTILGYCMDAGWDDQQTRLNQFDQTFVLTLAGPRYIEQIEMDPASMMIAMQMHMRGGHAYFHASAQGTPTPFISMSSSFQ